LRWHKRDADDFAPSIYAKRKHRSARAEDEPATDLPAVPEPAVVVDPQPEAPAPADA
jgi:hypothetical protein